MPRLLVAPREIPWTSSSHAGLSMDDQQQSMSNTSFFPQRDGNVMFMFGVFRMSFKRRDCRKSQTHSQCFNFTQSWTVLRHVPRCVTVVHVSLCNVLMWMWFSHYRVSVNPGKAIAEIKKMLSSSWNTMPAMYYNYSYVHTKCNTFYYYLNVLSLVTV